MRKKEKKGRSDGLKVTTFTHEGKRYYAYGHTKAEARQRADEKKKEIAEKKYRRSADLTFSEYYERWREAREGVVKSATLRKQESQFNTLSVVSVDAAGNTFGALPLREIETQHVRILQRALQGARAPQTVNDTLAFLSHVLHDAVNERAIDWNPCQGVKPLKRVSRPARETIHRALTDAELAAFFSAAEGSAYYELYKFLVNSGCRVGEAAALTLGDIRWSTIHIHRTVTKTETGYRIGGTPKTDAGDRIIPVTPAIKSALDNQREINAALYGDVLDVDGPIFKTGRGNLLLPQNVDRDIARICRQAGLEKFTSHAFRDTFATRALESGMHPKTLQAILGHSDFSTTMNIYAHAMENTKAAEMQRVKAV